MEPVLAGTIGVPVNQHGLHIVEQDRVRHAVNRIEEPLVAVDERLELLIVGKPDEAEPAVWPPAARSEDCARGHNLSAPLLPDVLRHPVYPATPLSGRADRQLRHAHVRHAMPGKRH